MDTKLTLQLDNEIIKRAKSYAQKRGKSLSDLVENYFKLLTSREAKRKIKITPLVKSLKTGKKLPANFNEKKVLTEALREKYGDL